MMDNAKAAVVAGGQLCDLTRLRPREGMQ